MKEPPKPNLEEHLQTMDDRLLGLYDTTANELPEDEKVSLLPILNSLTDKKLRYSELGPIAEGGEKRLTRVHDHRLNRQVAMARASNADNEQDQEKFLREAQLEANLAHPNIVPVHNMGFDPEGVPFFTMELIPGDSLKTILNHLRDGEPSYIRDYPLDVLLNLFLKICDAIAYAHSRNVLHLDIKPDNIRVGEFGEVFVCDWGLAKVLFEDEATRSDAPGDLDGDVLNDLTLTDIIKGTPGFMAPEQANAEGEKTTRTDIYALGVLLYMILTLELPVEGESANAILENTRAGNIVPPHRHWKSRAFPHSLAATAMKALAFNPENRYDSANELHGEIIRYQAGYPTTAERASIGTSLSLMIKRHNQIATILIFFLCTIAIGVGASMVVIKKQKAEAVAAWEKAEENFRLYREQQEAAAQLNTQLSISTEYALQSSDYSKASEMILALDIGLHNNTNAAQRQALLLKKGELHFVLQEFNEAVSCYDRARQQGPPVNPPLEDLAGGRNFMQMKRYLHPEELSRKYAQRKPNDLEPLPQRDIVSLIASSNPLDKTTLYIYHHHMRRTPPPNPKEHLPLTKVILNKINRTRSNDAIWNSLKLEHRPQGWHLDITKSPYTIYTLKETGLENINVLYPLDLHSLDISNLPLLHLGELSGLRIKELNMSGIHISRTSALIKTVRELGVQKLIIDIDAYDTTTLERLRELCEVIDSQATGPD